jgi:integrase
MYRKRAVFYNALGYAVERNLLPTNPIDQVQWSAPEVAETVDRRVVASPEQVKQILAAVRSRSSQGEHLYAFFAVLYYAGLRPSEAIALRADNCVLPQSGWGRLDLTSSELRAGQSWTDDGGARDTRGLKHRSAAEVRSVPIPPTLVQILPEHIEAYGEGSDGRIFRSAPRLRLADAKRGRPGDRGGTASWAQCGHAAEAVRELHRGPGAGCQRTDRAGTGG